MKDKDWHRNATRQSIQFDATDAPRRVSNSFTYSASNRGEHTHVMSDVRMELDEVDQAGDGEPPSPEDKPSDRSKGKVRTTAKPTAALAREAGKSLLPISRVQKIMKADKVRSSSHSTCKQVIIIDVVLGVTYSCEGGRVSHIISNGRIYQEIIRGWPSHRTSRETGDCTTTGYWCDSPFPSCRALASAHETSIEKASVTRRADEFLFLEGENRINVDTIQ